MKRKQIAYLVGIIILLAGAYWYLTNHKASAPDATAPIEGKENQISSNTNSSSNTNTKTSPDYVAVSTQTAGSSVTIDNFLLSKPGFISIEQNGTSIGHSGLLVAGSGQDLEITAAIKKGSTYSAVIYVDDGDKKFNAAKDTRLEVNGNVVGAQFTVK